MKRQLVGLVVGLCALAPAAMSQVVTLDRQDDSTFKANLQFGITLFPDQTDVQGLNTELYAQGGAAGFGGYVRLSLSSLYGPGDTAGPELGNLELGGHYTAELGPIALVARLGVALPTASDGVAEVVTRAATSSARLTDAAADAYRATTLRLSVSPVLDLGIFFLRADAGLDFRFPATDLGDPPNEEFLRLNLGLGVDLQFLQIGLELVNIGNLRLVDDDSERAFLHTITGFVRGSIGPAGIYFAYTKPLDDGPNELNIITLGASVAF